jgi:hypothetical protein
MLLKRLDLPPDEFTRLSGWEIKPEGACKGEVCVPLQGPDFDLQATAERLGMAVVSEMSGPDSRLWAFGPETVTGRSLTTTEIGDFTLPDLDGNEFSFSSLRGSKVLLIAWAPY